MTKYHGTRLAPNSMAKIINHIYTFLAGKSDSSWDRANAVITVRTRLIAPPKTTRCTEIHMACMNF